VVAAVTGNEFAVVVVGAETPGNVGTIARAMKNFGVTDLRLVDPPELEPDGEAYGFAGHAREDVLPNATETTLDAVVREFHTVGFTAITNEDARRHVRFPFRTPRDLRESLRDVGTRTALVFGRESTGLDNAELARLDEVCAIPANPEYPVLNLGQAATVALYELRTLTLGDSAGGTSRTGEACEADGTDDADGAGDHLPDVERERASEADIERFYGFFSDFVGAVEHREHKRRKADRMVRRLVGRAHPTEREVSTLTGLLRKAVRNLESGDDGD
jgi:TrmH family RNA methyltransferase